MDIHEYQAKEILARFGVTVARDGWQNVPAVRNQQVFEVKSADILQPGPAALTDGVAQLHRIMQQWEAQHA